MVVEEEREGEEAGPDSPPTQPGTREDRGWRSGGGLCEDRATATADAKLPQCGFTRWKRTLRAASCVAVRQLQVRQHWPVA